VVGAGVLQLLASGYVMNSAAILAFGSRRTSDLGRKVTANLTDALAESMDQSRRKKESVSGFVVSGIKREVKHRKRGGKVIIEARQPGRPKKKTHR